MWIQSWKLTLRWHYWRSTHKSFPNLLACGWLSALLAWELVWMILKTQSPFPLINFQTHRSWFSNAYYQICWSYSRPKDWDLYWPSDRITTTTYPYIRIPPAVHYDERLYFGYSKLLWNHWIDMNRLSNGDRAKPMIPYLIKNIRRDAVRKCPRCHFPMAWQR